MDGLDPAGQVKLKRIMRRLVEEEGRTIFLSGHDLADVEELADDVVVINRGELVTMGRMQDLLATRSEGFEVAVTDVAKTVDALTKGGLGAEPGGAGWVLVRADRGEAIGRILWEAEIFPEEIRKKQSHLEKVFLSLTKGGGIL